MLVECSDTEILLLMDYRRKKTAEGVLKKVSNISARNRKAEAKKADSHYLSRFLGAKFLNYIKLD